MFVWVDGHLILAAFICPVVAFLIVGNINARIVRRCQKRRDILNTRGGAS